MARVLVVDDEPGVREGLVAALELEGHDIATAADGRQALATWDAARPDVVILDQLMPFASGVQVCETRRARGDRTPILMLTARDGVADRVAGLQAGADDYLGKPFAVEELLARVAALLRRTAPGQDEVLALGDLRLDRRTYEVHRGGRPVELTRTEFRLLEVMLAEHGRVVSRGRLREEVWGYDPGEESNLLGTYVSYLRRKLGEPELIHTVRGVGYSARVGP
jgi:two-component system response regulator MprA